MHTESRFSEVTDSFRNGFLADRVILAIAKVGRSGEVEGDDKLTFAEAAAMIESAIQGHNWIDNPQVTPKTPTYAMFFAQAVSALPEAQTSDVFVQNLGTLRETASQLAEGMHIPEEARLIKLRTFFFNASQAELERTEKLLEGENAAETFKWIVSGE